MKKLVSVAFLAVFLLSFSAVVSAETKVGAVNVSTLMDVAPQAKAASASIKARFGDREKSLLAERDALRAREEKYNRDRDVMAVDERDKTAAVLREDLTKFKADSEAFTKDLNAARNEALTDLQTKVYEAITQVAESGGYDVILSEAVLYANKKVDITDQVLDRLKASGK